MLGETEHEEGFDIERHNDSDAVVIGTVCPVRFEIIVCRNVNLFNIIICWIDVVCPPPQRKVDLVLHFSCLPADHLGPDST